MTSFLHNRSRRDSLCLPAGRGPVTKLIVRVRFSPGCVLTVMTALLVVALAPLRRPDNPRPLRRRRGRNSRGGSDPRRAAPNARAISAVGRLCAPAGSSLLTNQNYLNVSGAGSILAQHPEIAQPRILSRRRPRLQPDPKRDQLPGTDAGWHRGHDGAGDHDEPGRLDHQDGDRLPPVAPAPRRSRPTRTTSCSTA